MAKPNKNLSEWIDQLDDSELMSISLGELIKSTAKKFPDTEALVYSNQPDVDEIRWTYKDLDEMEALGMYEVAPEDFALTEFICVSKQPHQDIIRKGLDLMYKEIG